MITDQTDLPSRIHFANPISVSSNPTASWDLGTELDMYAELPVDGVGLSAFKLANHGWQKAISAIVARKLPVKFLAHGLTAQPGDNLRWKADLDLLSGAVTAAARLGAPTVFFTSGPSGILTWEQAADRLAQHLKPLIQLAQDMGVALAVENTMSMNGHISFAHSIRDALELAEILDVGMCVDLLCGAQDAGLEATLSRGLPRIQIIQVSDFRWGTRSLPNRWVPGDGDLPMSQLLARTLDVGYTGLVDIEILGPAIDLEGPESALRRSLSWLGSQLGR